MNFTGGEVFEYEENSDDVESQDDVASELANTEAEGAEPQNRKTENKEDKEDDKEDKEDDVEEEAEDDWSLEDEKVAPVSVYTPPDPDHSCAVS